MLPKLGLSRIVVFMGSHDLFGWLVCESFVGSKNPSSYFASFNYLAVCACNPMNLEINGAHHRVCNTVQ